MVNLIKNENELVEEEAKCISKENVEPKNGKQLKVEFECKIKNIKNAKEFTGLEIISSEDITGIPTESKLINPAIVDELIEDKEIVDYISESIEIPIFNSTSIITKDSKKKGTFIIIGEFLSEFKLETRFEFDLVLITGEKAICILPKIVGKGEVEIKCELQEELKDSKIMIGQCSVLDGYKEIIKINKISTEKEVTVGNGKEIKSKKYIMLIYHLDKLINLMLKQKKYHLHLLDLLLNH